MLCYKFFQALSAIHYIFHEFFNVFFFMCYMLRSKAHRVQILVHIIILTKNKKYNRIVLMERASKNVGLSFLILLLIGLKLLLDAKF